MALPGWAVDARPIQQQSGVDSGRPRSCRGCPLEKDGEGWVPANGSGPILIVGEAPGEQEAKEGKPFVGPSGQYLDRILARAGLDRSLFTIHNTLSCRPPHNKLSGLPWAETAIAHCGPNLDVTLDRVKPKVIVAVGNVPLKRLTGFDRISRVRGYVLDGPGCWVVPTFHPAHLLPRRGQPSQAKFFGTVIKDLRKAIRIHYEGFRRQTGRYLCDPPPIVAQKFLDEYEAELRRNPRTKLSLDIETPYKLTVTDESELVKDEEETEEDSEEQTATKATKLEQIIRISFAFRPGYAMSVPFEGPWLPIISRFLHGDPASGSNLDRPIVVWNGEQFDIPVLEQHGFPVRGRIYDFMWGWHLLESDLPRGLESVGSYFWGGVPWKHEASRQPAWYNAVDSDVALWNAEGIEKGLRENGQWELFERHVVELGPVLRVAGTNGLLIDVEAQKKLETELEKELTELTVRGRELVPKELWPRKLYKRPPLAPLDGREFESTQFWGKLKVCSRCGAEGITKGEHVSKGGKKNPCHGAEVVEKAAWVQGWNEILPFNLGSRDQFLKWVKHVGHRPGEDPKTGKVSVGKKWLSEQARKYGESHPLYKIKLRYSGVVKTLSVYVRGLKPDERGLVYGTYSQAPSTGRLSQHSSNFQNISHRGTALFAEEVRRTIIPGEGYCFVEADSSAIEAVFTGYFIGSPDYILLAQKGIHDYLTCMELGIPFDEEGIKISKATKAVRDRNKQTIHASSYGMGPRLMHKTYPEIYKSERAAREAQEKFFAACPGLREGQHRIRTKAHKVTYLVNPWGYRHYFWDVFKRGKNGKTVLGDDSKRAVAFLPQSSAAAFLKDNALIIAKRVPKEWLPANFLIHDSYTLRVPVDQVDTAVDLLAEVLTRPIPELGGLRVGCEIKVGRESWADVETVRVCRVA